MIIYNIYNTINMTNLKQNATSVTFMFVSGGGFCRSEIASKNKSQGQCPQVPNTENLFCHYTCNS